MQACLVLLLALAVADASSEPSKRGETLRNIELLRRSALDKNFMRFGRGGDNFLRWQKHANFLFN
jgi:FMRFamide related peptide family